MLHATLIPDWTKGLLLSTIAALTLQTLPARADDLENRALSLLKQNCYRCHGQKATGGSLNVTDVEAMIDQGYVIPGNAKSSFLWQQIESGEMPPQGNGLAKDEVKTLHDWIQNGAQAKPSARSRNPVYGADVVRMIHRDLMDARREHRPFYRYFSLCNLHNNPQSVSDSDLKLYRAALSKMLNSLSRNPEICLPIALDKQQTVFRIDLRDLDWDASQWQCMLERYPYGLNYHHGEDRSLADLDRQIDRMTQTALCWVRADWFIAKASRSPLYENFLKLPHNLRDLERSLDVDVVRNFNDNTLQRAGFTTSGVSTGHRVVERHRARDGYYWKSFDFRSTGVTRDVIRLPLGPRYDGNEFNRFAFEHDGGEIIFSLPNGMQGYMLVDERDRRINEGPIDIVRDIDEVSGTPQVVNAISCIHCHRDGIISFQDAVREGSGLFGRARVKTRLIYASQATMDRTIERDRNSFQRANSRAINPFLEDLTPDQHRLPEPIGALARFYDRDLSRTDVAAELEIAVGKLRIGRNEARLGLDPLNHGQRIKRKRWESLDMFVSPFQQTAQGLGLATPIR